MKNVSMFVRKSMIDHASYLKPMFAERAGCHPAYHYLEDRIFSSVPGMNGNNKAGYRGQNTRLPTTEL